MQKITPFLWFNTQALDATKFYCSIFKNSEVTRVMHMGNSDSVISTNFILEGQAFIALNGGPHFSFNPAISLFVDCEDQAEVDELWERLSSGGEKSRCGWLKDKYGLSWQIIPQQLSQLMSDADSAKSKRVMDAMKKMDKIIISEIQRAYENNE